MRGDGRRLLHIIGCGQEGRMLNGGLIGVAQLPLHAVLCDIVKLLIVAVA
jgi:hypothetical protein